MNDITAIFAFLKYCKYSVNGKYSVNAVLCA